MKASVSGRVRNTSLPRTRPLLPVYEAVMNAFQAIEETGAPNGHIIRVHAAREQGLDNSKLRPFDAFTISDTGVGFTDSNYDSFNTVDSPYKVRYGGKGLGRFVWLKAFERVQIDSHYRNDLDGALMQRRFTFLATDDDPPCKVVKSDRTAPLTTVQLSGYCRPYRDTCPRSLEVVAQRLIGHFLPLFLNPASPSVIFTDDDEEIDLHSYFRMNFESLATRHEIEAGANQFTLHGFRLHGAGTDHHELVYGAHFREVITERLGRYLPNLGSRLIDRDGGPFTYLGFVQGAYLDEKVNAERTDFSVPREGLAEPLPAQDDRQLPDTDLFAGETSLRAIRDAAIAAVSEDLKPYLDEINRSKIDSLSQYIAEEAPQYRILMKYKDEFIDQVPPAASKAELEMTLHRQLYQRQVSLKEEGKRILAASPSIENPEEFYRRFESFVTDENEIGKTALARYVVHRRVILNLLEKALSLDPETGKYGLEKTIHSLVFPMRITSDDVPFEQQNLWIIDERLTFHSFLSSDMPLRTVQAIESNSDNRPDILIFNQRLAFSEDNEPLTAIVVIEFKKPDRANYNEDPVSQAYRMIRDVRDGRLKDKTGRLVRAASRDIPAYCYIVCDLTSNLETRIQDMGGRRTPDNLGYYGFNEALNAYYEIVTYTKILADAKKRNRILFEKLNLQ
jgi:hypothetical protein